MVGYRQGGYRSSALVRKITAYLVSKRDCSPVNCYGRTLELHQNISLEVLIFESAAHLPSERSISSMLAKTSHLIGHWASERSYHRRGSPDRINSMNNRELVCQMLD